MNAASSRWRLAHAKPTFDSQQVHAGVEQANLTRNPRPFPLQRCMTDTERMGLIPRQAIQKLHNSGTQRLSIRTPDLGRLQSHCVVQEVDVFPCKLHGFIEPNASIQQKLAERFRSRHSRFRLSRRFTAIHHSRRRAKVTITLQHKPDARGRELLSIHHARLVEDGMLLVVADALWQHTALNPTTHVRH